MSFIIVFVLTVLFPHAYFLSSNVDPSQTVVWGPGLKPHLIIMRARYIFLQLRDNNGNNVTTSPGTDIVSARIQGVKPNGQSCRVWTQILDCQDGSFIIRYKLFDTCFDLSLKVQVKNQDVSLRKTTFKGPVYEDDCYCPNPSIKNWLNSYECVQNFTQMDQDLSRFRTIDFDQIRDKLIQKFHRPHSISICHYVVKDNRIYRKCYGQHVGFKIFMDAILLSLARKVMLPDTEFFVNLGDWPLTRKDDDVLYPIFSWCGSTDTNDIVMPTYDITESSMEAMGRVMIDMLSVQGNTQEPWENRIEQVFWRGRDSRRERLNLIDIARKHPDLFNASITNFFFFRDEIEKYGPGTNHVSFFHFFKYKYQLNIDGSVAAYRFPYLLASDSLTLKQDSKYYEFFYRDLTSDVHYVPVKQDLSDLVEKVLCAKEHDTESRRIAKTARQFARDNLLPQNIFCYHVVLFHKWSKLLKSKVKIFDDMEEVQKLDHPCNCVSNKSKSKDEL